MFKMSLFSLGNVENDSALARPPSGKTTPKLTFVKDMQNESDLRKPTFIVVKPCFDRLSRGDSVVLVQYLTACLLIH